MNGENDDEDLAIRMMCGDKEALREVLKRHLEPVREVLSGTYGTTIRHADLDEAVNRAIYNMWRKAGTYDKSEGTLGGWFFTIAQRAALDIFRREKRHRKKHPLLDENDDVAEQCVGTENVGNGSFEPATTASPASSPEWAFAASTSDRRTVPGPGHMEENAEVKTVSSAFDPMSASW